MPLRTYCTIVFAVFLAATLVAESATRFQRTGIKAAFQKKKGKRQPGEKNTPPARGERARAKVKEGDAAPDFTLPTLKGDTKVTLSSFEGKKPVVLIFGSYT